MHGVTEIQTQNETPRIVTQDRIRQTRNADAKFLRGMAAKIEDDAELVSALTFAALKVEQYAERKFKEAISQ